MSNNEDRRERSIRQTIITLLAILPVVSTIPAVADVGAELDAVFNEMTNYSPPNAIKTQRRGGFVGGRLTTKSKIYSSNLVSITPPSFKAGCGGIDMYGGSFSYINEDEIVNLLKSVASNAKGYAFHLALDNVCPSCATTMQTFQEKVGELNQHMSNSCQMAQTMMDGIGATEALGSLNASLKNTVDGTVDDLFQSYNSPETPQQQQQNQDPAEFAQTQTGNIVWKALKENNVHNWFSYGDSDLMESLMSLTGSVVITGLVDDPNIPNPSGSPNHPQTREFVFLPPKPDVFLAMLEGSTVDVYNCSSDPDLCIIDASDTQNVDFNGKGIYDATYNMLLGNASNLGLIDKYASNAGTLTSKEEAFITNLPSGTGTLIRNLSILSPGQARTFANEAAKALSVRMVGSMVDDFFRATKEAVANSDLQERQDAFARIGEAETLYRREYEKILNDTPKYSDLLVYYKSLIETIRKQRYALNSISQKPTSSE